MTLSEFVGPALVTPEPPFYQLQMGSEGDVEDHSPQAIMPLIGKLGGEEEDDSCTPSTEDDSCTPSTILCDSSESPNHSAMLDFDTADGLAIHSIAIPLNDSHLITPTICLIADHHDTPPMSP